MLPKRNDLQCWRSLSIIAILLFHIWPERFPNGYLGVDMYNKFFVISGYLMASIYLFDGNFFASIINFYYRRIKRILPIYLIIILITLLILTKQIFIEEYKLIVEDSKWAIILATNYEDLLKKRGYFETEGSFRFFRHCWSLAVEMQFYFIFPFIAVVRNCMSKIRYQVFLALTISGSIVFQVLSTNQTVQYESLLCRIWQFSAGMFAQTLSLMTEKFLSIIFLLTVCSLLFCKISLQKMFVSLFTVILTASIITLSKSGHHPFKSLFRNSSVMHYIVYLGDVSYVLYLIHWPLITYAKFMTADRNFTYFDGFLLFMTSIFLSMMVHIVIEKPILNFCNNFQNFFICLAILYLKLFFVTNLFLQQSFIETTENLTPSNLTQAAWERLLNYNVPLVMPEKWGTKNDIEFAVKFRGEYMGGAFICEDKKEIEFGKAPLFYCVVMGNPNGTLTGLSIGNSFSMNIVPAISSNHMFKKTINLFANDASFPNHDKFERYLIEKLIKVIKPDVTFIVQKYFQQYLYDTPNDMIRTHKEFKHWKHVLNVIEKYTSAIIINKEQIAFPFDISQDYIRKKFYGLPIQSRMREPPRSPILESWLTSLNCSKCEFFSYREAFCESGYCNIIDLASGLPVFRDPTHISPLGIRHIKPFIDKAINKALKNFI